VILAWTVSTYLQNPPYPAPGQVHNVTAHASSSTSTVLDVRLEIRDSSDALVARVTTSGST